MDKAKPLHIELEAEEPLRADSDDSDGTSQPDPVPGLIELVLAEQAAVQSETTLPDRIDGVLVGRILAVDTADSPRVTFPQSPTEGLPARAMISLGPEDVGRAVALMFEGADPRRPIVMGRMVEPARNEHTAPLVAEADGRRIEIVAEEQLVLRCGEASITLTRAGKIIIRGAYVLSRSSGVNRIQGGSVEIN